MSVTESLSSSRWVSLFGMQDHSEDRDSVVFPGSAGVYRRLSATQDLLIEDHQRLPIPSSSSSSSKHKTPGVPGNPPVPQKPGCKSEAMPAQPVLQQSSSGGANTCKPSGMKEGPPIVRHPELRTSNSVKLSSFTHQILRRARSSGHEGTHPLFLRRP